MNISSPRSVSRQGTSAWRPRPVCLKVITAAGFVALLGITFPLAADTIYVSNYGDSTVTRITADGQKQTYASGLRLPYGLAFDAQGNLYAADQNNNVVVRLLRGGGTTNFATGLNIP